MKVHKAYFLLVLLLIALTSSLVLSQDDASETDCAADALQDAIEAATAPILEANPNAVDDASPDYIYAVGDVYLQFALDCGYQPTFPQIERQVERTLDLVPLSFVIAASSIGNDLDAALAELETVDGNSFNGQLLYNGLEVGLDGAELGCAGCHNGEVAPLVEGTYTRVIEERLSLAEFAEYDATQYLVESILHPSAYILPEYSAVQMPENYGGRLDAQQLADLIAYLESQDQELDSIQSDDAMPETTNNDSGIGCQVLAADECATFAELEGNALRGENLYNGTVATEFDLPLSCVGCHSGGVIGPDLSDIWTRIQDDIFTLPQFEGYTGEEYLIESILEPDAYVAEGYPEGVMPSNYDTQIGLQDLADLVAYLRNRGQ